MGVFEKFVFECKWYNVDWFTLGVKGLMRYWPVLEIIFFGQ